MTLTLPLRSFVFTVTACAALLGCGKPDTSGPAQSSFEALAVACTQHIEARKPHVHPGPTGDWIKTGYSPAQVQREVTRTESAVTPYVGKIVVKDNEAQASAPTEAEAQNITLTPAHLLSNRTHTFIYSYDGTQWRWQNGQRLTKMPGHNDAIVAITLADVSAAGAKGFAGCIPSTAAAGANTQN